MLSAAARDFLIGVVIGDTEVSERVTRLVNPVRDLFGALFFLSIGMLIDYHTLGDYIAPALVVVAVFMLSKIVANAWRNKEMSYGRMNDKAAQLRSEVAELLRRAEEVDEEEAADEAGPAALRDSQGDGGAGVRADQAGPGPPAVPAAGPGGGEPGVAAGLHRPQPAEAVPVRARVGRPGETPILGPEPASPGNLAQAQAMGMLTPEQDKTGDRQLVQAPSEPIRHSSDGLLAQHFTPVYSNHNDYDVIHYVGL